MRVRELLQAELWSKRTSRKILVAFGIVVGLSVLACAVGYEVEVHWLTQGERVATKAALQEIDALQDAGPLSDEEVEARTQRAEAKVRAAENAATTYLDASVEMKLGFYLVTVKFGRAKTQQQRWMEKGFIEVMSGRKTDNVPALARDLMGEYRSALHEALD